MHWPGASVMIIMGAFSFAFIFIPFLIFIKFKEVSFLFDNFIYSIGIALGTILMIGFIFKLMHWPWATILMLSSIVIFNFVYIPLYFISRLKREELKFNTVVNSVVMFSFGSILLALFDMTV
jgi:Zn-dependent membrane protease YugP